MSMVHPPYRLKPIDRINYCLSQLEEIVVNCPSMNNFFGVKCFLPGGSIFGLNKILNHGKIWTFRRTMFSLIPIKCASDRPTNLESSTFLTPC